MNKKEIKTLTQKNVIYEIIWLDITSETRGTINDLENTLPVELLSTFHTIGRYYKHDDYAYVLYNEIENGKDKDRDIDYVVIPFSNIIDYKIYKEVNKK
jgi:hypothetical protein|tara:strand:- start:2793 stop:3089 length:297 start_codon:yes stop_codon:yes gene_type:complete